MPPKREKFVPFEFEPRNASSFTPRATSLANSVNSSKVPSPSLSTQSSTQSTPFSSTLDLQNLLNAIEKATGSSPLRNQFQELSSVEDGSQMIAAVDNTVNAISEPQQISDFKVIDGINALLKVKKRSVVRESALLLIAKLANKFNQDPWGPAFVLPLLPTALFTFVDKEASVINAAKNAVRSLQDMCTPEVLVSRYLNTIFDVLETGSTKPATKVAALQCIDFVCEQCPSDWIEQQFVRGIPILTAQLHDFKPEVAKQARKTTIGFMQKLDNQDVVPRTEVIVDALTDPGKVQNCIKTLSSVTFVAEVTEPCLAVLVPILVRALTVFSSQDSLRLAVIVTENLTRLVHNPFEVSRYVPFLLPGVKQTVETASLPEVRNMATKALAVLESALNSENQSDRQIRISSEEAIDIIPATIPKEVQTLAADVIKVSVNTREFDVLRKCLTHVVKFDTETANKQVLHFENMFADTRIEETDEDGIEVVNARFSLAYGGRMLLNKATLRLFKGHRYGLCGRNGCGKSTLLRSIANGKLEGFPDQSEVRTCFVEHKLQGADADLDIVTFISNDPEIHADRDAIANTLKEVGFNDDRLQQSVGSLSGGWKMKLELARAMLMNADVLLLDEPTNHLDVANVKWLQDYLTTHTDITSLIVSHDSGFLDAVCTDIIHYENKRLAYYKGNLSEFVKVRPEGMAYYTLTDSVVKMHFPAPGILTGVRSNTRAIARMTDITFKYPGAAKNSLENVSCSVSLSSRITVIGPNGAGKSTLIKLLTGELVPDTGKVEKHPNLRIGYIAQHAFQHVEKHKEKTANQYLQWRYQNGDDREIHLKQTRLFSDEEKAIMERPQKIDDGRERVLEAIIGRQKLKKSFQYEVQWKGMLPKHNSWMAREDLVERGFGKLVQEFDDHEASREGLGYRELVPPVIRKHFEDVGLDGDVADYTPLGSLSGGQLVKVVIAGATWNNPHLLVLDEPTNYLDRDSLGGLAMAIKEWNGGVILISHNTEFLGAMEAEQWLVDNGTLVTKNSNGDVTDANAEKKAPKLTGAKSRDNDSPADIKIRKKKKKLTRNEMKEREARRRLRYIEWLNSPKGTPKPVDTDDEEE
ncbi:New1 protein [Starmerella bacillaris]|uniref:New1 protein n=1 Tax=Starmerella bacillaris TaxID=1247836 RepID=A0AAV5RFV6_STABA|nr:New1 protein [Starmerella bacillaris]